MRCTNDVILSFLSISLNQSINDLVIKDRYHLLADSIREKLCIDRREMIERDRRYRSTIKFVRVSR
jgi:hypothetical protein